MLLRHSSIYLFVRGIPALLNFAAVGVYTRLLSPEEYGLFAVIIAIVNAFQAALFRWLRLGVVRFFPAVPREDQPRLLSTIIAAYAVLVIVTGGICFFPALVLIDSPRDSILWGLGIGVLWIGALFELTLELVRVQLQPARYGVMFLTKSVLAFGLGGISAYLGYGAAGLLTGLVAAMFIPLFIYGRRYWRGVSRALVDPMLTSQLLTYGLPLTVMFTLNFIISTSDRLILAWLRGQDEAGIYAASYDLPAQTLTVLITIVALAGAPLVFHAAESKGLSDARRQLGRNLVGLLIIGLPSAAAWVVLAPNISHVFLGAQFRGEAVHIMPLVAISALVYGVTMEYVMVPFQLSGATLRQVFVSGSGALVNILLNLLLIPHYGPIGAAYATLAAYGVTFVVGCYLSQQVLRLPVPLADVAKVVVATTVMVLLLSRVSFHPGVFSLLVQVVFGLFVYGLAIGLLNMRLVRSLLGEIRSRRFCRKSER